MSDDSPVSGNRPKPQDRRPPQRATSTTEVGLARIVYPEPGVALCTCSWQGTHVRAKVLEDMIDRHLNKKHGGRGIRL